MNYNKDLPFNDLSLLPPQTEVESIEVLRKVAEARAALAELKGRCTIIPNPLMLINTIVLQEAKASSEIENIVTTSDSLYRAFSSNNLRSVDAATKEVLRYREALYEGYKELKNGHKLDKGLFVRIVSTIVGNQEGIRDFEKDTERIIIENRKTGETIYTPPEGFELIKMKLDNLSFFLEDASDKLDPLIKLAISHYQFEAIHPFKDGNGRTGRIINSLFLVKQNLLDLPILYLSKYIIENKSEYYKLLRGVTENQYWISWVSYILDAVKSTSHFTLDKINAIKDLLDETIEKVRNQLPNMYSKELVEQLFFQPYCRISFLVDKKIGSRNTASRYLNALTNIGILVKRSLGKERLYLNKQLFDILSG